jgi:hypothetical protein
MGSASAWLAEEHWDCGAWFGLAVADETRQPQSVSSWLRATHAERRHGHARDEEQTK